MALVDAPTKMPRPQYYDITCPACGADRRAVRKMLASKNATVRKEAAGIIERCHSCSNALYGAYRRFIGKCETCGALMATHPRCEACGALCGGVHEHSLSAYRKHEMCGPCLMAWKGREKDLGREITWSEFAHPYSTHTCSRSGKKKPRVKET